MSGAGMMLVFGIKISAIIVLIIFGKLLKKSAENKGLKKLAFAILSIYLVSVSLIIIIPAKRYNGIPNLAVEERQFTVINEGTGSMGSYATYACSKEGTIKEINQPCYTHYMKKKFGYTFEAVAAGELYLAVLEHDCDDLAYADIYAVKVEHDLSLEVTHVEKILINTTMTVQKFISYISGQYGFSKKLLEEKYELYLNK